MAINSWWFLVMLVYQRVYLLYRIKLRSSGGRHHLRHQGTSLATPNRITCTHSCTAHWWLGWGGVGWCSYSLAYLALQYIYIYIIYIDTYIHMQGKVSDLEQVQKTTPAKPNRASAWLQNISQISQIYSVTSRACSSYREVTSRWGR